MSFSLDVSTLLKDSQDVVTYKNQFMCLTQQSFGNLQDKIRTSIIIQSQKEVIVQIILLVFSFYNICLRENFLESIPVM